MFQRVADILDETGLLQEVAAILDEAGLLQRVAAILDEVGLLISQQRATTLRGLESMNEPHS